VVFNVWGGLHRLSSRITELLSRGFLSHDDKNMEYALPVSGVEGVVAEKGVIMPGRLRLMRGLAAPEKANPQNDAPNDTQLSLS
jgi:hypothetical protein